MARYNPNSPLSGAWQPSPEVLTAGNNARVRYVGGRRFCDGHTPQAAIQPGTRALRNWVVENWPAVVQTYMPGRAKDVVGCTNLDVHIEGRGIDFMKPHGGDGDAVMQAIASWLVMHADEIGVEEVLYNKTAFVGNGPGASNWHAWEPGAWGNSDHGDHIHISLTPDGAAGQTPWFHQDVLSTLPTSSPWTVPLVGVSAAALATVVVIVLRSNAREQARRSNPSKRRRTRARRVRV